MKREMKEGKDRQTEENIQIEQTLHFRHYLSNLYISSWMQHCDRINRKVQRKVLGGLPRFKLYTVQKHCMSSPVPCTWTCYIYKKVLSASGENWNLFSATWKLLYLKSPSGFFYSLNLIWIIPSRFTVNSGKTCEVGYRHLLLIFQCSSYNKHGIFGSFQNWSHLRVFICWMEVVFMPWQDLRANFWSAGRTNSQWVRHQQLNPVPFVQECEVQFKAPEKAVNALWTLDPIIYFWR